MSGQPYISKHLRELVSQQARYRCGYCLTQERVVGTPMEIDHIIPQSLGGPTDEGLSLFYAEQHHTMGFVVCSTSERCCVGRSLLQSRIQ